MKIDLAGMIARAGRTRRRYFVARAIRPTAAQELTVRSIYLRVVKGWAAGWNGPLGEQYARTLRTLPAIGDSVDQTRLELETLDGAMSRLVVALGPELDKWTVEVERWHRRQFASSFVPAGVRLDTLLGAGDTAATLRTILAENASLVRSLNDQMRAGVSAAVFRGLSNRTPARDVAKEVRKITSAGASRANLIAADQLQKLTARLDQQRQEQVGATKFSWVHSGKRYPRQEHLARQGKVYEWKSKIGREDPPGRAIRCGCRARPVIELDEGAAPAEVEPPTPAPAPPPAPTGPRTGFRSPVRADVNAETIKIEPRLTLQKRMRPSAAQAAKDPRYDARREFRDRTDKDFGNVTFGPSFDDAGASLVAALKGELDDLADQLGVPRLRGYKTLTGDRAAGNMGDGVMGLNGKYVSRYASKVGGRVDGAALADITAQREAIRAELEPIVAKLRAAQEAQRNVQYGSTEWQKLEAEIDALRKPYNRLRDRDNALWRRQNTFEAAKTSAASTWKPGDDPKQRPFTTNSYFADGVEKARVLLFHEFGHHVHQMYDKVGPRRTHGKPPVEVDLVPIFRAEKFDRDIVFPSTYAETNEHEWFAENFARYVMGRRDLVTPGAKALIESLFNGTYRRAAS